METTEGIIVNADDGIKVGDTTLDRVKKLVYLGSTINESWDPTAEIKSRIEQARTAFVKMRNVLCSHDLSIDLTVRITSCYIFFVLLYGVEAWTLTEAILKR
ncbi:unnamed protein product [Diabrotica balteata]|uniref:Uncharacterized protein n=1 Tax=Diabrotica balteata TaxID=107213 RepID=A0A9N9TAV0_DIABA|nr:unnamed protein product [Diabrotica balteata]